VKKMHPETQAMVDGLVMTFEASLQRFEETSVRNAQSINAVNLRGASVVPIGSANTGTKRPMVSPGAVLGWSMRETTGAGTAVVALRDGADSAANLVTSIQLPANGSVRDWFGPSGLAVAYGLYVDVMSGSIEGAVYLRGPE